MVMPFPRLVSKELAVCELGGLSADRPQLSAPSEKSSHPLLDSPQSVPTSCRSTKPRYFSRVLGYFEGTSQFQIAGQASP